MAQDTPFYLVLTRSEHICHVFIDSLSMRMDNQVDSNLNHSQTLVTSLTAATAKLSTAASHMCQFYCRSLTLFLIHILLENNSVVNNLYQTIFQEYHRIGHWITRDIYTKKKLGKNVFVDVCLPACLFIHLFIYYLEVAL